MLAKIGEGDTAWIAADRAAFAAESLSNPLAVAASLFPDLGVCVEDEEVAFD